jgi:spermidine synthase
MNRFFRITLLILFFGSGLTSLIYETLWIRVLALGVGSTSGSMSLVLAVFFGGLSLGSLAAGRWSKRVRNAGKLYAALEAFIGLYSLLILYPLYNASSGLAFLSAIAPGLNPLIAKTLLTSLFLLPPTLAMGATLPLLTEIFPILNHQTARGVGALYGINTLGALTGAVLTGYLFVPMLGITGTNLFSVAVNLLIAAGAFFMFRHQTSPRNDSESETTSVSAVPLGLWPRALVMASAGASGFTAVATEVIWNKYLAIFFGTNLFGLSLVLGVYLFGMGIGSLLVARYFDRVRFPLHTYTFLFALSILLQALTGYAFRFAPAAAIYAEHFTFLTYLSAKVVVAASLLIPPMMISGALFPIAVQLITRHAREVPQSVGLTYAVNTVGAILGSALTGLWLIPNFGSSVAFRVASLVGVAGAIGVGFVWESKSRRAWLPLVGCGLTALFVFLAPSLSFDNILRAGYQVSPAKTTLAQKLSLLTGKTEEFKLIIEGQNGVISLSRDPADGDNYRNYLRLKTNGLNESVYTTGFPEQLPKYEALLGALPYLFAKDPRNAFVVGYGGGFTVDLLTSLDLPRVHVVELEKGILKAADYAHHFKNPITKRANLALEFDDARYVLSKPGSARYDIIVSQPSHSWVSGSASLFTEEFFQVARGRLTEGGVFAQWLNLYNMDTEVLRSILDTFFSVFESAAVFTDNGDQELILLGSTSTLKFDYARAEALAKSPKVKRKLVYVANGSGLDFLGRFAFSKEDVAAHVSGAVHNTDRNVYAEARQSRLFYSPNATSFREVESYLAGLFSGRWSTVLAEPYASDPNLQYSLLSKLSDGGQASKFLAGVGHFEARYGSLPGWEERLAHLTWKAQRYASSVGYGEKALAAHPNDVALNLLISAYYESGKFGPLLLTSAKYKKYGNYLTECYRLSGLVETQQLPQATLVVSRLGQHSKVAFEQCGNFYNKVIGRYYQAMGQPSTAVSFYETYLTAAHSDAEVERALSGLYRDLGQPGKADENAQLAQRNGEEVSRSYRKFAKYLDSIGKHADADILEAKADRLYPAEAE